MSVRSEVCNEFGQYMGLDDSVGLEGYVILSEFQCPLGELARELQLVKDAL